MSNDTADKIKNYVDHIDDHIAMALNLAQQMQAVVLETEGDSDLNRKLAFYLIPNLTHWVAGAQAGNMKDLKETLARRLATQESNMLQSQQGEGHDVLTKPSKT